MNILKTIDTARNHGMQKKADGGIANDLMGAAVTAPLTGGAADVIGNLVGYIAGKPSKERLKKMDEHPGTSWAPGVGSYRAMRKLLDTVGDDRARSRLLSEGAGAFTSALIPVGLGAAAGYGLGGKAGAGLGAAVTAGATGVLNTLITLIATARKRRTQAEQEAADKKDSMVANWLVPGLAAYRAGRRLPSVIRREDDRNKEAEKDKDKKEYKEEEK